MNEAPPLYFRPGEVRAQRDADRRRYRNLVVALVAYQFILAISVRLAVDFVINNEKFKAIHFIKPYVLPGMAVMVLLLWVLGIGLVFRRKY